jgi:hypothetical protein
MKPTLDIRNRRDSIKPAVPTSPKTADAFKKLRRLLGFIYLNGAVAALNNATALNRKISLGGPEPLSWGDIISIMEARLGRSIPVKRLPVGSGGKRT